MSKMARWLSSEAKQQFSEVVRRSAEEPQEIFLRDRLVAAVISADDFEEFERFRKEKGGQTLDRVFQEVRELASQYDYELETGERRDREDWTEESS
jgi:prevent-host-death family protein